MDVDHIEVNPLTSTDQLEDLMLVWTGWSPLPYRWGNVIVAIVEYGGGYKYVYGYVDASDEEEATFHLKQFDWGRV